jgi:hypothetical protein
MISSHQGHKKTKRGRPRINPDEHLRKLKTSKKAFSKEEAKRIRNLAACAKYRHTKADELDREESELKKTNKKLTKKLFRIEISNRQACKLVGVEFETKFLHQRLLEEIARYS